MKHEWKKHEKALYLPEATPELIEVPALNFFTIEGEGHPGSPRFQACVEALYAASYAVRMSYRGPYKPDGYVEYTVYPLEGLWDLIDPGKGPKDKNNFKYSLMIRQPDFLTAEQAEFFLDLAYRKKGLETLKQVRFETIAEGRCIQMLHLGPFDDEPVSFEQMAAFCREQELVRDSMVHREIYLSDARKVAPEKLKTVLRFKVRQ